MIDRRSLLLAAAGMGVSGCVQRHTTTTTTTTVRTTTIVREPIPLVATAPLAQPTPLTKPTPLAPPTPIVPIVPRTVRLWSGDPPGGGGPFGGVRMNAAGAAANVTTPTLTVYRPSQPNGTVVIIAAGGGYRRIEIGPEATPAAQFLAAQGITACVLTYRLPGEGWLSGVFAPFQDAQRAVRLVRQTDIATGSTARPRRVGVLGFSAGGHLMGMAAAQADTRLYPPQDGLDADSARPDFAALIYPVISIQPPLDHSETRRMLVGEHPVAEDLAGWSVETHVGPSCPPVFMAQAADDTVAPAENSAIMYRACQRAGVKAERMLFPSGGHAFGLGRPGTPSADWPGHFLAWSAQI